jgi:hypothetical protein
MKYFISTITDNQKCRIVFCLSIVSDTFRLFCDHLRHISQYYLDEHYISADGIYSVCFSQTITNGDEVPQTFDKNK